MENLTFDNPKENKMSNMPIKKLLFSMSIPAMISMFVQAMYNIVDTFFVGLISTSEMEISALNYAMPLQMVTMSIALGIGIGTNSVLSRKLGEKRIDDASKAALNGYFMIAISFFVILLLSFFLPKIYINLIPALKGQDNIKQFSVDYLQIIMACSFGMYFEVFTSKVLQGTGNMKIPMIAQLIGALTNIILDPIFIFESQQFAWLPIGFGMGVKGAAVATVLGQIFAAIFVLIVILTKKQIISLNIRKLKIELKTIANILRVGLSVTVMNSITAFTNFILALKLSIDGSTVLGIYFKIQSLIFMPVFGLTQGALPILGYNYGAKLKSRFNQTIKYSLITAISIMVIGLIILQIIPNHILSIFNLTNSMDLGIIALRIISISFIPAGISIIYSTVFQSTGRGLTSLLMNLTRQVVILIPLAYILLIMAKSGEQIFWISFPISELICCLIFVPIAIYTTKKLFHESKIGFVNT